MFIIGLLFLIIGAVLVYGSKYISQQMRFTIEHKEIFIKLLGFVMALIGTMIVLNSDIPKFLEFMQIIDWLIID
ncbi:MAG: hypothetical protein ACOYVK_17780 [Bacillota bacterium]